MKGHSLVIFLLLAIFNVCESTVQGTEVQPQQYQEFHYTCNRKNVSGTLTYDYEIHFNTSQQQIKHIVAGNNQSVNLNADNNDKCFKIVEIGGQNATLTNCSEDRIYVFEEKTNNDSSWIGGKDFKEYELSCLIRDHGATYIINSTVKDKEPSLDKDEKDNPDLLLNMNITGGNTSPFEIGQELTLKVTDKSSPPNVLYLQDCEAQDAAESSSKIDLIKNRTNVQDKIVIDQQNNTEVGEVSIKFYAFRFTKSTSVVITCSVKATFTTTTTTTQAMTSQMSSTKLATTPTSSQTSSAKRRKRRSLEIKEDKRQSGSVLNKLKEYASARLTKLFRSKRTAESFGQEQSEKTLKASFTVKGDKGNKGSTEKSRGNGVSASALVMAPLVVLSAVGMKTRL